MASRTFEWAKGVWNHPAGPRTIFFWAPTFKWSLGLANIADYNRPPGNAITATSSDCRRRRIVTLSFVESVWREI